MKRSNSLIILAVLAIAVLFLPRQIFGQDITIVYTGQSHAALFPCHCPYAPNGGIARRYTKLQELRKLTPNLLLLDSGSVFAGGLFDTNSRGQESDKMRTQTYLEGLSLMKYDAIAIGDEEFNFGDDFLFGAIEKYKIPFISSNINSNKILPFVLKKINKTQIGILAATGLESRPKSNLEFQDPTEAIQKTVQSLKKQNIDLIILLSQLGEEKDKDIAKKIGGIDIIISGKYVPKQELMEKVGPVVFLYPKWEARSLCRARLKIKDSKITDINFDEIPLDSKVKDSPEILTLLPACLSDADCRKQDSIGKCENPGGKDSRCVYVKASEVPLTIIKPKVCKTCDITKVIFYLQNKFPGLKVTYLDDDAKAAADYIRDLGINMLPVFIFNKTVEKEANFKQIEKVVDVKKDYYILKPSFSGVSFFLGRPKIKGSFDVFVSLKQKNISKFLEAIKGLDEKYKKNRPNLHFLAFLDENSKFQSPGGVSEVEEYLRGVCVKKYYPEKFWDYLICRAQNFESSWWEDCCLAPGIDKDKTKQCAQSDEAKALLRENIKLTQELNIYSLPSILLDNQEIVTASSETRLEEIEGFMKK